jgi:hypothetical protein
VARYIGSHGDASAPSADDDDQAWAMAHPDDVLAAGDAACDWLAAEPAAPPIDPTGVTDFHAVINRYLESPGSLSVPASHAGRGFVVAGAWAYLCWTDRELHTSPQTTSED